MTESIYLTKYTSYYMIQRLLGFIKIRIQFGFWIGILFSHFSSDFLWTFQSTSFTSRRKAI
jgi:hypothetical protein